MVVSWPRMRPLSAFPATERARIKVVFTDIDDTLTTDGRLTADAYSAMARLQASGLRVIPITGRPAGWCDHIARMWPVDAVVGENGAFYFHYDTAARSMRRRFLQSESERAENHGRLMAIRDRILDQVPGTAVAADQAYRAVDLAIDFCEDVPPLPPEGIDRIVAIAEQAGATAKVSSIHVNIWFGKFDKLTMTGKLMTEVFGLDIDAEPEVFVFVGDSPNDAPMFGFFPNAVGVANLRDCLDRLAHEPAYITQARAGAGFTELAEALLTVTRRSDPRASAGGV